jgi:hypothetical protein
VTTDLSGAHWYKSSYSGGQTDCVEIAWLPDGRVGVRDSKNVMDPALVFEPGAWAAFARGLRGDLGSVG